MANEQNTDRNDGLITAIRFPIRLLTVALVLTIVTFAGLGWSTFDARRDVKMYVDRLSRIEELRGVILRLDEVLTMSARMAVATGESKWEERYHRLEPQLAAAIKETKKIGTDFSDIAAAAKTDEANNKLVGMENRAFALVRASSKQEAQAVLFSPEYETQKQVYVEGMTSFVSQIRREFDESLRDDQRIDLFSMFGALVAGGISVVAWWSVARSVRRWRVELVDNFHRRVAAEENLRKAYTELETRVHERTADLARSNEALRVQATALDAVANAILITDPNGAIQSVNPAFTTLTGYTAQEVIGKNPRILKGDKQDEAFYQNLWQTVSSGRVWSGELTNRRKDGTHYVEEMTITPMQNADGLITRYIAIKQDVTGRKRTEEELRFKNIVLTTQQEASIDGILLVDENAKVLSFNHRFLEMWDVPLELVENRNDKILLQFVTDKMADPQTFLQRVQYLYEHRRENSREEILLKEGQIFDRYSAPMFGSDDRYYGRVWYFRDITERKHAEEALSESEQKFRQLVDNITDVFWMTSPDMQKIHYVSPAYEQVWGRSVESLHADPHQWVESILPEERERVFATFAALGKDKSSVSVEYRISHPDGTLRWLHDRGFVVRDAWGNVIRHAGIATDVTERKRLEAQLFQSQKLETVGKLAGGVAHEFNSILTAIIGQSELLLGDLPAGSPLAKNASEISQAAGRAASLTRQLLAYGRKQILQPETLDLNSILAGLENTLRHLMGRAVEVLITPAAGLNAVKADAGQIEQVIMNLAMNAADAMPNGGKLILETSNVTLDQDYVSRIPELKDGDYVMLAITDTGTGMSEEVKARVFEPFFSTKGVGQGTGLGLSTCYGIIKQSGGHIAVYSELGRGTSFKIYLPQVEHPTTIPRPRLDSPDLLRGTETILLVEDDPALREMAATLLRRLGYTVLAAANGIEALSLKQQRDIGHIDLLFTDVVMPHMSGKELSERVRASSPHTRILFTSAYTESAIVHQGILDPGVSLLPKPFTPSALARRVHEVLGGRAVSHERNNNNGEEQHEPQSNLVGGRQGRE